jgi:PAS fold
MAQPAQLATPLRGDGEAKVEFCSRCGRMSDRPAGRRVCQACGLGVLLSCPADALPGGAAAFLVVDSDLRVSAASAKAERLLGERASGSHVPELIAGRLGNGELTRQLARAANGLSGTATLEVSVSGRRGSFEARVSPCGPPRAALLVLSRSS